MKKQVTKNKNLSEQDRERLELLQQANEKKSTQLKVDVHTGELKEFDEIKSLVGKDLENPGEKYNIYYKGISRILMKYLPKGKENKAGRELIYDEKNIFLTMGKRKSDNKGIRGADGRMTFQPVMREILDILISWVAESQDPIKLYDLLWGLNEKHKYGHEQLNQILYKHYGKKQARTTLPAR